MRVDRQEPSSSRGQPRDARPSSTGSATTGSAATARPISSSTRRRGPRGAELGPQREPRGQAARERLAGRRAEQPERLALGRHDGQTRVAHAAATQLDRGHDRQLVDRQRPAAPGGRRRPRARVAPNDRVEHAPRRARRPPGRAKRCAGEAARGGLRPRPRAGRRRSRLTGEQRDAPIAVDAASARAGRPRRARRPGRRDRAAPGAPKPNGIATDGGRWWNSRSGARAARSRRAAPASSRSASSASTAATPPPAITTRGRSIARSSAHPPGRTAARG